MHVGVDQAGHQRRIAQVDGLRPGGVGDGRAGGNNLLSFDQHFSRRNNTPAFDIEQARGVENDWVRSGRSLCQGKRAEQEAGRKKAGEADAANMIVSMSYRVLIAKMAAEYQERGFARRVRITMVHNAAAPKDPRGHLPLRRSARPFGQGQPLPLR